MTANLLVLFAVTLVPAHVENVDKVLSAPAIGRAMEIVDESKSWSVAELIALTEIEAPPFEEEERGAAFMERLRALGLTDVWKDEVGNVYGERPGRGEGPTVVLSAHLDTVFPRGSVTEAKREDGWIFAPGIGDNTVGLVTLLTVLKALEEARVETAGTLIFMGSVGEEGRGDLRGVKHLFSENPLRDRIDMFVSVDGTSDDDVIHKALGSRRFRVTYRGPGGHSWGAFGTPNPGFAMARTLAQLAELEVPEKPKQSYNVGVVGGGTSINSIPAEVWMEIDLRGEDVGILKETEETFLRFVDEGVARENEVRSLNGSLSVEKELVGDRPSGEIPVDHPLVQTAVEVTRSVVKINDVKLVRSSTDANLPISLGVPAITIGGGGEGADAHAPAEGFDPTDWERGIRRVLVLAVALVGLP